MPIQSQAQRRLMYSAASKRGGAGGVSRSVAKEFVASDHPGKLPERVSSHARGGEITEVAGKPIGKDDGIIAAQRGEFVVKKSAVKKLGSAALNEINKGRLPSERLYGSRKAVRHA